MKAPSYVCISRNGVYYARFVLPRHLLQRVGSSVRDVRISLLTKDPRDAVRRARLLRVKMDMLVSSFRGTSRTDFVRQLQHVMSPFKHPPNGAMSFNVELTDKGYVATDIREGEGVEVAKTISALNKDYLAQISTRPPVSPEVEVHDPGKLGSLAMTPLAEMVQLHLEDLRDRPLKKRFSEKSLASRRAKLDIFADYFADRKVGTIDAEEVLKFERDLRFYPIRRSIFGLRPNDSVQEVIALVKAGKLKHKDGTQVDCLLEPTVSGYMIVVRQFLNFCIRKRAAHPTVSVVDVTNSASSEAENARSTFSDQDAKLIFESDFMKMGYYKHAYQYWIPHLAAFTGARVSELAQLEKADVVETDGVWMIRVSDEPVLAKTHENGQPSAKRLKTKESRRHIPVHPMLVELGFLKYVQSLAKSTHPRLFPEINDKGRDGPGQRVSRWFNETYLREVLGITDPAKVFHSFRHSVVTRLARAIISAHGHGNVRRAHHEDYPESYILRGLVGHSVAHSLVAERVSDAHEAYKHGVSPAEALRVLSRLTWDVTFSPYREASARLKKPRRARKGAGKDRELEAWQKLDLSEIF